MASAGSFVTPYLASNDNRSIAGIDCPLCNAKKRSTPLSSVPANRAVRIFVDPDLKTRFAGNTTFHYAHLDKLPEDFYGDSSITFWRCESCSMVFQNTFDELSNQELRDHIYNKEYSKTLPQSQNELPLYRAHFLRALINQKILKKLKILICESAIGGLTNELNNTGYDANTYRLLADEQSSTLKGPYDLVGMFGVLERMPSMEEYFKAFSRYTNKNTAYIVTYYPFSHKNENEFHLLAPRNGFFRLLSKKSLHKLAEIVKLKCRVISPGIAIFYNDPPEFIHHLLNNTFDESSLKITEESLENDEEGMESKDAIFSTNNPSEVQTQTNRITIRETQYGLTAYYHKDKLIGKSLNEYGQYLDADRELLEQLIRPNWTVIEGAANIGVHCMMMAKLVGEGGAVMAFEAYEMSRRLLGLNMELNDFDNVTITPLALGAEACSTRLMHFSPDAPGSLAAMGWNPNYNGEVVPQVNLDSITVERCDFMHICAPEQEPDILRGANQLIENFHPALLVNCVNKEDFETIQQLLSAKGYRLYWHIQPFFLEENYFGSADNVFGSAGAAKILALHDSKDQNVGLQEIKSIADWVI